MAWGCWAHMFLLSDVLVRRYIDRRGLSISPLQESNLAQTCYYFRVGRYADVLTDDRGPVDLRRSDLVLPPGTMARVESRETFKLPESILGLLGSQTNLPIERRLQLIHGPSIDPGYEGLIEFVVMNIGQKSVEIAYEATIGKLMFFDITETSIDSVRLGETARARGQRLGRDEH
jgi:deoxycytidine triphosphate deaminase